MESCAEFDDDVYYADLERQIMTLMVDDEDDSNMASATASRPLFHQQVHSWKLPNRENSAGTGVFIPQTQEKAKDGMRGKGVHANRKIGYRIGSRKDK